MFRGLINTAKSAASSLVLKYVARASVAVPFVIAAGFALAAGTVMLVERYGQILAYWSMAGGLAAVGLIAAFFVREKENQEEVADEKAEARDTASVATEVAAQAPLALLGGLFTLPGGPGTALKIAKGLGNNFSLVLLLVLIGALLWPDKSKPDAQPSDLPDPVDPITSPVNMAHPRTLTRTGAAAIILVACLGAGAVVFYLADPSQARAVLARAGW